MNKNAVNEWIVKQMSAQDVSMRELARRAGSDHSYISKVISGKREAALDFYIKIAEVLGSPREMLQVAGVLASEQDIGDDVWLWEVAQKMKGLPLGERKILELFLDFLLYRRQSEPEKKGQNPT